MPYFDKVPLAHTLAQNWLFSQYQAYQGFKSKIPRLIDITAITTIWGHSSAGRAPAWHAGGQRFESAWLHLFFLDLKGF